MGPGRVGRSGGVASMLLLEPEAPGTYRIYDYVWVSADEYDMKSVQYDASGKATRRFYGGRSVRK